MLYQHFYGIFVLIFCDVLLSTSHPMDVMVLQIQKMGVIGDQRVPTLVVLHGVSLRSSNVEVKKIIKLMSSDTILPPSVQTDKTSHLIGHSILRSQECILERGEVQFADHVFFDNEWYLTLDHNDTWTVHAPKALALKLLLDQGIEFTRAERIHLQEGCLQLIKELRFTKGHSEFLQLHILIPAFGAVILILLIIASIHLSMRRGSMPIGGVLGSIIHYPRNMTEITTDQTQVGYRSL